MPILSTLSQVIATSRQGQCASEVLGLPKPWGSAHCVGKVFSIIQNAFGILQFVFYFSCFLTGSSWSFLVQKKKKTVYYFASSSLNSWMKQEAPWIFYDENMSTATQMQILHMWIFPQSPVTSHVKDVSAKASVWSLWLWQLKNNYCWEIEECLLMMALGNTGTFKNEWFIRRINQIEI